MTVRQDLAEMVQVEAREPSEGEASHRVESQGPAGVRFHSILFERIEESIGEDTREAPDCFVDLNLDQVIDAITASKQEYNLKPLFYTSLHEVASIQYRQEVMQELEGSTLFKHITAFARKMAEMREHLAQANKLYYKYQKERWFLDAVEIYCDAVATLVRDLASVELKARGFLAFREYVTSYARSERFASLVSETKQLIADLSSVKYSLLIKGKAVTVRKYEQEADYSAEVEDTFEKFKQGAVKDYRVKFFTSPDMNHVEAQVLDGVAHLYPEVFAALDSFCARHAQYFDERIRVFDREVQFYVAYLEYLAGFKRIGLRFCYPRISNESKEVFGCEGFDLALAQKLISDKAPVVCNDFYLKDQERILVVSGPNQGGKTTFARTFGQLHYLASLGCPVPGREAQLFLYDNLFTHFEKEESIKNLRGKLEDDLIRIREILDRATPNSLVLMNESFTATTLQDAVFLSTEVMKRIIQLDLLCVCVTFLDELTSMGKSTVSMVSTVVPENPALRTFKIVRRPADGLAYALAIAEKYRLTYDRLRERSKP
jgi:DNA mismatch repair protein MutS